MNEQLTIQNLESQVTEMTKFDVTKEELQKIVDKTKSITASNLEDKVQLELVKKTRLELRGYEIEIEKTGKGYRDIFNKANKLEKEKENELLDVVRPETARLKELEDEAKEIAVEKEQRAKLPKRMERLAAIGDGEDNLCDEDLMKMDSNEFEAYYNSRVAEKLEDDRVALEEEAQEKREADELEIKLKRDIDEAKLQAERDEIVVEKRKIEADRERLEYEENARIAMEEKAAKEKEEAKLEQERLAKFVEDERKREEAKEAKRLELLPDKEKLELYADDLLNVDMPLVESADAIEFLGDATILLAEVTNKIKSF